jgi:hypothetical protein
MSDSVKSNNRARAARAVHEQKSKERADEAKLLKANYLKGADSPVLLDVLAKARSFAAYHTKLAQDGVGVRKTGHKLENSTDEVETVYYSNEKRLSELDRASGLQELVAYIERQLEVPAAAVQVADDSEESEEE